MQNLWLNLGVLHEAIQDISKQNNINKFWESVCKNTRWIIPAKKTYIVLQTKNSQTEIVAKLESGNFSTAIGKCLEYDHSIFNNLINSGENTWIENSQKDPLLECLFKNNLEVLSVPIKFDNSSIGLILFSINLGTEINKEEIDSLTKIYSLHVGITYKYILNKSQLENKNEEILKFNHDLESSYLALEKANLETTKREKELRFLADSISHLVWSADSSGHINYFNKYVLDYFNIDTEKLINKEWIKFIHSEDIDKSCQLWKLSLKTGVPYQIELRIKKFDSQYRWFLVRAVLLIDDIEKNSRWFGTCTDIHEQKENEDKIKNSNEELKQFAYIASHDLQEPLRTISGYTTLLARRYKSNLDDEAKEFVEFITEGTKRMQSMISDLLEYSQIGGDNLSLHLTDLNFTIQKVIKNLDVYIKERKGKVTFDNLPVIPTRESLMILLFQNLITNGLKYNQTERPEVHISCIKKDDKYVFSITDNGIGIEEEYLGKIFDIFKRLHTRDQYSGTGIGLAICKKIIEKHGGTIWVESNFQHGTSFYFYLKS